jgi:hypothetical protein
MLSPVRFRVQLRLAILFGLLVPACSGPGSPMGRPNVQPDGGEDSDSDRDDGDENAGDSGRHPPSSDDDAGAPLDVHVQVSGARSECGKCSVLIAQVQGGKAPYVYDWSDPKLQGPGPHMVCPAVPTEYSVKVTDSSEVLEGEFAQSAMVKETNGKVECTAPTPDAGALGDEYFQGCGLPEYAEDMPANKICSVIEATGGPKEIGIKMPRKLAKGHTYELTINRLLPLTLGQDVRLVFYGSNELCVPQEQIGTIHFSNTWSDGICFTAERDYDHLFHTVEIDGVLFSAELAQFPTFCETACTPD